MGNTYEYTGIDTSLIMQVVMGAEVKEAHCKAVVLQEGKAVLPTAGAAPIGILLISSEDTLATGTEAAVQVSARGLWKAGAAFAAGELLAVDAEGLCQKAASGQFIYARALEAARAKGDIVKVQIINAGYVTGV